MRFRKQLVDKRGAALLLALAAAYHGAPHAAARQAAKLERAGGATAAASAATRVGFLMRARGAVTLKRAGEKPATPARSFTPLLGGDVLSLPKGAQAEIVLLATGRHVRATGPGQIALRGGTLTPGGGAAVTPLKPVPVAMLRAVSSRSETIGGVRLRGPARPVEIASPRYGVRSPSGGAVTLAWKVPAGVPAGIPVEVSLRAEPGGERLLSREVATPETALTLPGGLVEPGRTYRWSVACVAPGVAVGSDSVLFRLLTPGEQATLAEAERAAAGFVPDGPTDAGREVLLGYAYEQHGLAADALAQYEAARAKAGGGDPALDEAVRRLRSEVRK